MKNELDEIVFRCFAQGQYWGTEKDGKLDPDYKPEKPIDRTEAVKLLEAKLAKHTAELVKEAKKEQVMQDSLSLALNGDGYNFKDEKEVIAWRDDRLEEIELRSKLKEKYG